VSICIYICGIFLTAILSFKHIRTFKMFRARILDHQWQRLILILSEHEKILEEKIQPKSKIMEERILDLKNQVTHFRLYLICVRYVPEALVNAEARLNRLGLDICNVLNLSGVDFNIKIVKSFHDV
jgi:hypothetical protein